ncbi:MAG: hypothetical protein UZ21_OP11001000093 [Microgenomates bacterium OLB22]|nr:MAG: hypothetical protein UZ21_OP11001000093 [Microgenomates bacterium OLB22]
MLTKKQQEWLEKLSDVDQVQIYPYNPAVKEIFQREKQTLLQLLGDSIDIYHMGASSLEISGKGDVDIYIPVEVGLFEPFLVKLKDSYGEPGSVSLQNRARFNIYREDIELEILLVNKDSEDWTNNRLFWNHLKENPSALIDYERLKESSGGMSTREYYRRKILFINEILSTITDSQNILEE